MQTEFEDHSDLSPGEQRRLLREGEFVSLRLHPRGSNYVFDAVLEGEGGRLRVIYKPRRGEAPLDDFPDGTLYKREYAAYLVSQALGWSFVPLTTIRDGPHGIGMVQVWTPHDPRANYFTLRGERRSDFERLAVFDVLTNNADRKAGHCLLGSDGRIWAIDHGLTFHSVFKLRTVIWDFAGDPLPPGLVPEIERLVSPLMDGGDLALELGMHLDRREVVALCARLDRLLETPVYPHPGPRRSVPWPPI